MRVLHTSDWHLGRSFHRESLLSAQAAFVEHLVETVRAERVDVVVVSGDVYDRALPPVDAVALCDEALARLKAEGVHTVLISGNHDSSVRLGFGAGLMERVHLRTDPARAWDPVVVGDVAFYGIPYLEPELVRGPWELAERTHTAAITHAMERIRADRTGQRKVVLAHAFVTGGEASDSERDISVGGVSHVPLAAFAGADYVALGHLHGRQVMSETVRYSGSPIAYSFSEAGQRKGSWLVDLDADGPGDAHVDFVPAPVPRPVGTLSGRLDDLLTDARHADREDHWLQVTLTDPVRPREAMERLRRRFPHTLALAFKPDGPVAVPARPVHVAGRAEIDVAADFVREVRGEPADDEEIRLLGEAVEASRIKESL